MKQKTSFIIIRMKTQYNFQLKKYKLNSLLNKENVTSIINKFWLDVVYRLDNTKKLRVILILDYGKGDFRSLSRLVFVDKKSKIFYIKYITYLLNFKSEDYHIEPVINIYFKYVNVVANASEIVAIDSNYYDSQKDFDYSQVKFTKIKGYNLPNNMNYET
jgi:hypothetical protein